MQNLHPIQRCMSCMTMPSFSLEGRLGRTYPDAGRIITVVAEEEEKFFSFNSLFWRYSSSVAVGKVRAQNVSFHIHLTSSFVITAHVRHIMDAVAGVYASLVIFLGFKFAYINDKAPSLCFQDLGSAMICAASRPLFLRPLKTAARRQFPLPLKLPPVLKIVFYLYS